MFHVKGQIALRAKSSPPPPFQIQDHTMVPKSLQSQTTSEDMDPGIWSKLPGELLEHVLSFLPLKIFLNLRSTCKRFNSLVFSPPFISRHSSSPRATSPFSSFLLLSHPQFYPKFQLYDSILGSWRNLTLSVALSTPGGVPAGQPSSCTLLSSSNGLFCFSLPSSGSFLVSNVLAKSFGVVEYPSYPFSFESSSFVSSPFGYKIFILCSKFSSNYAYLYDSKSHSWRKFDGFEPILSDNFHQEGVLFDGSLYFTTPEPFSVVHFGLDNGKWEKLESELPRELAFVRLVSDGAGKLYLVGGVGSNGISRSIKLWQLDDERNWIEVESLPEMICRKFLSVCYHNYEHVYCFWHPGLICLCCYNWPEILYYKISRRTWHWLPRCPSLPEKWSCGFKWFSFVPELYASV